MRRLASLISANSADKRICDAGAPLNDRQRTVVNRLLNGFEGKLTSSKYAVLAKCSQDTASRDIDDLVGRGVLAKDPGGGRSTSYVLIVTAADALGTVARYVRLHADKTARDGAALFSPEEAQASKQQVEALADRVDDLAKAEEGPPPYADFELLLHKLHDLGFHPDGRLLSAVAHAIQRGL